MTRARWACITVLAAAATTGAATPASAAAATPLQWRIDAFANEFWVLDHVAAWDGEDGNAYATAFEQRFKLDDARRELLRSYAAVRRAHARHVSSAPDVRYPVDVMPPVAQNEERFALAFLLARDETAACAALHLDARETAAVTAAFAAFRKDIDTLVADSGYLSTAAQQLEQDAKTSQLADFVDRMKLFYAVDDDAPYVVHVLWAPPHFGQATVWDHEVILPLSATVTADRKDLAGWLGVIVHELGHALLSERPDADKRELSRRIVDASGLLNQRHSNIIDEATQAALGNILFLREHLPEGYRDTSIYSFEPKSQYPDAIDSLARAAAPLVAASLGTRDGFAKDYLPKLLEAQRRLFGDAPLHHAHVALLFTADHDAARDFNGMFWSVSRWNYDPANIAGFASDSHQSPTISRWIVLTAAEATPELLAKLEAPIAKGLAWKPHAACARAARRRPDGGYDVVAIGRDHDAVRRLLIELHRARAMPTTKPLCVE
jgi:hypothetical protein